MTFQSLQNALGGSDFQEVVTVYHSNEELAERSKSGDTTAILELWSNLEPFIDMKLSQYMRYIHDAAIDRDDLKQASYFAMLRAINYYNPNKGYRFITYFSKTLLKEFNITAGFTRQQHVVVSLDAKIPGGSDDSPALLETLADEAAQLPVYDVLAYDWQLTALRSILEALALLSAREQVFIWGMYFDGLTQDEAGAIAGYSCRQASNTAHARIMKRLRQCSKTAELRELLDCCDTYGDISSLAYHVPADVAAIQNIRNQKRRECYGEKGSGFNRQTNNRRTTGNLL